MTNGGHADLVTLSVDENVCVGISFLRVHTLEEGGLGGVVEEADMRERDTQPER